MVSLFIGALAMASLWLTVELIRKRGIELSWWQWLLTVLAIGYGVFVLELVVAFLAEGEPRAALVIGTFTGFVGVVWGVLLRRLVFSRQKA